VRSGVGGIGGSLAPGLLAFAKRFLGFLAHGGGFLSRPRFPRKAGAANSPS
jgi:hypothetical protein